MARRRGRDVLRARGSYLSRGGCGPEETVKLLSADRNFRKYLKNNDLWFVIWAVISQYQGDIDNVFRRYQSLSSVISGQPETRQRMVAKSCLSARGVTRLGIDVSRLRTILGGVEKLDPWRGETLRFSRCSFAFAGFRPWGFSTFWMKVRCDYRLLTS